MRCGPARQNASSRTVRTPKSRVQVAFASRHGQLPGASKRQPRFEGSVLGRSFWLIGAFIWLASRWSFPDEPPRANRCYNLGIPRVECPKSRNIFAQQNGRPISNINFPPSEARTPWCDIERLSDPTVRRAAVRNCVWRESRVKLERTHQGSSDSSDSSSWAHFSVVRTESNDQSTTMRDA